MFYIKRTTSAWRIERRLYNGKVTLITMPTPDYVIRGDKDSFLIVSGTIQLNLKRADIVVPQGENIDAYLTALLNPSIDIAPGGGGGEINSNIYYVITPTYSIVYTNFIIVATMDCSVRLPTIISPLGAKFEIHANGFKVDVLCDDPSGDRIVSKVSVKLKGRDSATFRSIDDFNWGII